MKIPVEKLSQISQALETIEKPAPTEVSVKEMVEEFLQLIIQKHKTEGISLNQIHEEMMKYLEPEQRFSLSTLRSYFNELYKAEAAKTRKSKAGTSKKPKPYTSQPIKPADAAIGPMPQHDHVADQGKSN